MYSRGKQAIEWVRRTGKIKVLVFDLAISLLGMVFLMSFGATSVSADGGAVIGGDNNYGSGSSSGSHGGRCPSSEVGHASGIDCMGASWVFYEATGNAGAEGVQVRFSPRYNKGTDFSGNNVGDIPAACSLPGRGVWVYSVGGVGKANAKYVLDVNGNKVPVFSTSSFATDSVKDKKGQDYNNVYSTSSGGTGQWGVLTWGWNGGGGSRWATHYRTHGNSRLDHVLYKKIDGRYVAIYKAKRYGVIGNSGSEFVDATKENFPKIGTSGFESSPRVWREFSVAYKYRTGTAYEGTSFPNSLTYFCYWEGMNEVTLYGQAVNENEAGLNWSGSSTVTPGTLAALEAPAKVHNNSGTREYGFIKWINENGRTVNLSCPRLDGLSSGACLDPNNGRIMGILEMKEDRTLRAVYGRRTLKGTIRDTAGNYLNWPAGYVGTMTVPYGDAAGLTVPTIFNRAGNTYTFQYFENEHGERIRAICPRTDNPKYACIYGDTGWPMIASMLEDRTLTAVFRKSVTLTGVAKDIATGRTLPWPTTIPNPVLKMEGERASLGVPSFGGYTFLYWKNSSNEITINTKCPHSDSSSACIYNDNTLEVATLRENMTYTAYFGPNVTLTGVPIDENGNELGKNLYGTPYPLAQTVSYGTTATLRAKIGNDAPTGYTFGNCWKSSPTVSTCDLGTGSSYTRSNLTVNTTVYFVYSRNAFQGRVRVSSGNSVNESSNTSTGWVNTDTSKTRLIECANDGCKATFDLYLKAVKGSGKTYYVVSRSKNNGSFAVVSPIIPASPSAPAANGTSIRKTAGNYTESLKPGEKVCYRLSFVPYGEYNNTAIVNATACVSAKVSTFEGKSSVTGAVSGTTDWQKTNKAETVFIQNCSPTSGCSVSFNHRLKRVEGALGWTGYTIKRISNLTTGSRAIANNSNVKSGTFNASEQQVNSSGPFTLYPGMVICETLTFKVNNSSTSEATTRVCASALGNAQPADPADPNNPDNPEDDPNGNNGSNAFVDIEVRNNSVAKFNTFRRIVYAKPGDSLAYRASYNPNLQYTYYLKPQQMRVDGGTVYPLNDGVNTINTLATMFNLAKSPGWNNDIIVYSRNFASNTFTQSYDYKNGETTKRTETNDHNVVSAEVGRSLDEYAEVNYSSNNTIKTTPTQVTFTSNGGNNMGNVSTARRYKFAQARVPYNYNTSINLPDLEESNGQNEASAAYNIVYSGEEKKVNVKVDILPKNNRVTLNPNDSPYATRTGKSTVKLVVYTAKNQKNGTASYNGNRESDLCAYFGTAKDKPGVSWDCGDYVAKEGSLNNAGNLDGESVTFSTLFNAPDLDAGQEICVAAAIFPANSGLDTNYSSTDGSGTWRISNSRCFVVAKRPNLQVVGGGMYSAGNVITPIAIKRNIYNIYPTSLTSKANTTVFGSWVEHQIVAARNTMGIASGASTGYFGSISKDVPVSGRTPMDGLGGSWEGNKVDYCIRVPMTIANSNLTIPCKNRSIAGGYLLGAQARPITDKDKLIASFTQNVDRLEVDYNKVEGDYTIDTTTVLKGETRVVHATNDINIVGNIVYEKNYTNMAEVPKLVIYAERNINISCGVTRIDAIIIAGKNGSHGVVDTCPTSFTPYNGDVTSEINWMHGSLAFINVKANSNPLIINGMIIANKLVANRTYGAAKGINSVVSAETIDYDTTMYGWGVKKSEATASGKLRMVYQRELAPRY